MKTEQKYYIKHFSEMTCMSFYFISNNKENLTKNENLIDEYINVEYENYSEMLQKLKDNNIEMLCDEYDIIDDEFIENFPTEDFVTNPDSAEREAALEGNGILRFFNLSIANFESDFNSSAITK